MVNYNGLGDKFHPEARKVVTSTWNSHSKPMISITNSTRYIITWRWMLRRGLAAALFLFKAVAHPPQGCDSVGIGSQLTAKQLDMGVQRSVVAKKIIAPNFRKQLLPG